MADGVGMGLPGGDDQLSEKELAHRAAMLERARKGQPPPNPHVEAAVESGDPRYLTDPADKQTFAAYTQHAADQAASRDVAGNIMRTGKAFGRIPDEATVGDNTFVAASSKRELEQDLRADDPDRRKAAHDELASQEIEPAQVSAPLPPANYDPRAELAGSSGAVVSRPGGFQPERRSVQVDSGVAVDPRVGPSIDYATEAAVASAEGQGRAGAEAARIGEVQAEHGAKAQRAFLADEAQSQEKASAERRSALKRVSDALAKMDEPIENPLDRLRKADFGTKLAFVMASAVGGAMGYRTGTNPFLTSFEKAIETDMDVARMAQQQKRDRLSGSKDLFDLLQRELGSESAAREAMRAMYWGAADKMVDAQARRMGLTLNDARVAGLKSAIAEKYADTLLKVSQLGPRSVTQASEKYVPPQIVALGTRQGISEKALTDAFAYYSDNRQKRMQPERENTLNLAKRALESAPDGLQKYVQTWLAQNRGGSVGDALRGYMASGDPEAKKNMSAVAETFSRVVRMSGGKALTLSEQDIEKMKQNPALFADFYGAEADLYNTHEGEIRLGLGAAGPAMMPLIERTLDFHRNAPDTSSRALGAEPFSATTGAFRRPSFPDSGSGGGERELVEKANGKR